MSKNIFRPLEVVNLTQGVELNPPFEKEVEEVEVVEEEYTGPTAEEMRREAENFKQTWEVEKQELLIRKDQELKIRETQALAELTETRRKSEEELSSLKTAAEAEAEKIVEEARREAQKILAAAEAQKDEHRQAAQKEGRQTGREEGWQEGRDEAQRLVDRLHQIVAAVIDKRGRILEESETQIVGLVLLIAGKVIKVITEAQKEVIIHNVLQALQKLKTRGEVTVRVNTADLEMVSQKMDDFIKMVEKVDKIKILEDAGLERGGCLVETDFGEIDARIGSQIAEIENRIRSMTPLKIQPDYTAVD